MRRTALITSGALLIAGTSLAALPSAGAQVSAPPTVKVTDAGSQPRAELRLSLQAGSTSHAELRTKITLTQKVGGRSQTVNTPQLSITITAKVASVTPTGDAVIDFSYDKTAVEDDGTLSSDQLARTRAALRSIEGISGSFTITPTGESTKTTFDIPPDADATARQLIEQLKDQTAQIAVPFPKPAVGVGATWEATQEITVNGATIHQTTRYTLKKRTGSVITLQVRVKQRAQNETLDTPQGSAELIRHRATGKGSTDLDLGQAFPKAVALDLTVKQRLRANGQSLSQTVKTHVEIAPTD